MYSKVSKTCAAYHIQLSHGMRHAMKKTRAPVEYVKLFE